MLMQPQEIPPNPNPNMDFIMNSGPAPKKGFSLPKANLPRPVKLAIGGVVVLFIIIVLSSVLFANKSGNYQPYLSALARAQEISRVSALAQDDSQDQAVQNLAATVQTSLSSQQAQITAYLKTNKASFSPKQLAADTDKTSDNQMQTAAQNNNLAGVYQAYLKQNLALYKADLSAAYTKAGPKGKAILNSAYDSVQTLLSSPPLSSS